MDVTLYHNPRCSKSRATLALLEEKGITPKIVEYLKTPPSEEELSTILSLLGMGPKDLLRKKDATAAGLDATLDGAALIAAMVANPQVIERPIVLTPGAARLGRPPECVLEILRESGPGVDPVAGLTRT